MFYFNSHAHVERDDFKDFEQFYSYISTHTLTWSVTKMIVKNVATLKFQLTRSRGA